MGKYYAGVGSRETLSDILGLMTDVAKKLESLGFTLRSGGASGADSAFEKGVLDPNNMEIYLPFHSFNGKNSSNLGYINFEKLETFPQALESVRKFHPASSRLSGYALNLMARNCYQVLGKDLNTPSLGVIAWTPNGGMKGGTSQALRIAEYHGIPIVNLGLDRCLKNVKDWLRFPLLEDQFENWPFGLDWGI